MATVNAAVASGVVRPPSSARLGSHVLIAIGVTIASPFRDERAMSARCLRPHAAYAS